MLIVVVDVAMRYALSMPLGWSYDVIGLYLMVAVFFLMLPDTLHNHGHVAIDLFQGTLPRRLRRSGHGFGTPAVEIDNRDSGAKPGQMARGRLPQPASATCDQRGISHDIHLATLR